MKIITPFLCTQHISHHSREAALVTQTGSRQTSPFNLHFASSLFERFTLCSKAVILIELDTGPGHFVVLPLLDENEGDLGLVFTQDDGADCVAICVLPMTFDATIVTACDCDDLWNV